MYDIQNRCIPDEIDLFYFKTCIITHNNNVIEQNINVSMFDILSVKEPHKYVRQVEYVRLWVEYSCSGTRVPPFFMYASRISAHANLYLRLSGL